MTGETALLLIDLQCAIDDPRWAETGPRNNPQAEARVAELLANWRASHWPVIHVRHDSTEPDSAYRPGQPGHAFRAEAIPLAHETVIPKHVNSAFIGTGLENALRRAGITRLVVAGVITNNSVEATVRMAGNMGFDTLLAEDACFTFARRDLAGRIWSAEDVHALSLANLEGEYCRVLRVSEILSEVQANSALALGSHRG
ncbi:cysteine hydrolase family protein [Sphingomonas cavernae]|uniref:Cysteine hydrolase n=1 Tax=Sphingomonas cavernae TaxID=2320861 RepID=A0A418W839_9SPHN|nr:cysteine hydrolase family protein [Sphingomonas cavernae]RJF86166.1 cysteine hydrolase [Sphingomonas cavernae]